MHNLTKMNKLKLLVGSAVATIGSILGLSVFATEETAYQALEDAIATGTDSAMTGITSNLPAIIGVGVLIVVIFLVWRIFRRFAGGR